MLLRRIPRTLPVCARRYSTKPKNKVSQFIDDIGREETKTSQNTLKTVRYLGGFTIVTVLCSLLWASSMSAPVKETVVDLGDLSEDVRRK